MIAACCCCCCYPILPPTLGIIKYDLFTEILWAIFSASFTLHVIQLWGFPGDSVVKNMPANGGDVGLIPRLGRSPGEGNRNPLQDSCLENPMDKGAWWATVHGVAKSRTRLSNFTFHVYNNVYDEFNRLTGI